MWVLLCKDVKGGNYNTPCWLCFECTTLTCNGVFLHGGIIGTFTQYQFFFQMTQTIDVKVTLTPQTIDNCVTQLSL